MENAKRGRGWGLVVAALVLAAGAIVRAVQGEPVGALATIAVLFGVLGLASLRSKSSEPTA